jgi:hypothetical protein
MKRALLFAVALALPVSPVLGPASHRPAQAGEKVRTHCNATINPAHFTPVISNKYYSLSEGMIAGYEKTTREGIVRKEVVVTGETKMVMGITTLVIREREWLNDELVQATNDWVAQDTDGNVWYFGEAVDHYKNSKLVEHEGSWEAGVDGAKPGILMLSDPKPRDTYSQECYPGKAEDRAIVIAVGMSVRIPGGPFFQNCVHIRGWTPLDVSEIEEKYYCVGVGLLVLEKAGPERLKLVTFRKGLRKVEHAGY